MPVAGSNCFGRVSLAESKRLLHTISHAHVLLLNQVMLADAGMTESCIFAQAHATSNVVAACPGHVVKLVCLLLLAGARMTEGLHICRHLHKASLLMWHYC